jgi:DNA-binding transcriptional ArsR family regulator
MSELDTVLTAIADPTRRAMLQRLAHGPATTGQLAALFPVSRPAISQHLRALQDAGLVQTDVRGRHRWHQLVVRPLDPVGAWLRDLAARHAVAPRLQPEEDP